MPLRAFGTLVCLVAVACAAASARADGDDFFVFSARTFNADGTRSAKNTFHGSVKDDDGHPLSDAMLTIDVTVSSDDGDQSFSYKSYTNVIGRYRTLDAAVIAASMLGSGPNMKLTGIKLVGVAKPGYAQLRRIDRTRTGQSGAREIDFVMKKMH